MFPDRIPLLQEGPDPFDRILVEQIKGYDLPRVVQCTFFIHFYLSIKRRLAGTNHMPAVTRDGSSHIKCDLVQLFIGGHPAHQAVLKRFRR